MSPDNRQQGGGQTGQPDPGRTGEPGKPTPERTPGREKMPEREDEGERQGGDMDR